MNKDRIDLLREARRVVNSSVMKRSGGHGSKIGHVGATNAINRLRVLNGTCSDCQFLRVVCKNESVETNCDEGHDPVGEQANLELGEKLDCSDYSRLK